MVDLHLIKPLILLYPVCQIRLQRRPVVSIVPPLILPLAVRIIIAGPGHIGGRGCGVLTQGEAPPIFQHDSFQNGVALIDVHIAASSLPVSAHIRRFPLLAVVGLEGGDAAAALRTDKVDAVRRVNGVAVELALPCALAGGPAESAVLEGLPLLFVRLFVKRTAAGGFPLR